ncbi:MAG: LytTR family DNA-binding domain-containing protein [Butyrivibrio sp.]|nr:LytTR family DNA-binding domain-containing protein [Butyrivibrio sp.]
MGAVRVAICEDEQIQRVLIRKRLEEYMTGRNIDAEIIEYDSGEQFTLDENKDKIDIVLLDIYMEGMSGIELAKKIRNDGNNLEIIFITSSNEFAAEAFEVESVYYLKKPVEEDKFIKAMDLAMRKFRKLLSIEIFVNRESKKIYLSDIYYVETMYRKLAIHTDLDEYVTYMTLSKLMTDFPKNDYAQISRFSVVSLDKVLSYDGSEVLLKNGIRLEVSDKYKADFEEKFHFFKRG